ncbi:hypothetical protein EHM82_01390 [bacterium]|nr:MAG: hypothetical protein EHM82_01390 [bacterium]
MGAEDRKIAEGPGGWVRQAGDRLAGRLPDYLTVALAVLIWRVFYPGLMSADSISQYGQALAGLYNDWHPPLMAIALKITLALGGTIGLLMLAQCLAGVFGVRALATAVFAQLFGDRISPRRSAWLSLLVLAVLLIPVTPLAFYLMTFWKDAWAMVLLLWIGALSLDLFRNGPAPKRVLLVVALAAGLGLVRHNAVVVLPLVGLLLWAAVRRTTRAGALAVAAAPLALWVVGGVLLDRVWAVKEMHPDSQIMALDLVGLCAESRSACDRLPWTERHILDESALARYRPGDIGFIFWDEPKQVDPAIRMDYPHLRAEYLRAVREFPLLLAEVKLEAFATLLGTDRTYYYFHDSIMENPYGLALNPRFAPARQWLSTRGKTVAEAPVLRWISGVHLVWIVVNVLWVAGLLVCWRRREARLLVLAGVLLIPLGYYASYLFATPQPDFRFMYPATLAVQCVTLSWAIGGLAQKPTGRAPSFSRFSA